MEPDRAIFTLHPALPRSGGRASCLAGTLLAALLAAFVSATTGTTAGEEQAAPQPTPAPKPSPTPRPTPETRLPAQAKPATPGAKPKISGAPEPALSFTDFDLERYHKPAPPAEEPSADDDVSTGALAAPATPAPAGAPAGPPAQAPPKRPDGRATGARTPTAKRPAQPPQTTEDDPLRPFRDREAKEKFRTQQIQGLRERLAKLQARLDYLEGKRRAILDPLSIMPKPPEGADTQGESSMRPKELLEKVDEEIKALKDEQEEAQGQLASVETRFAQESQSR